jgi:predicted exporter
MLGVVKRSKESIMRATYLITALLAALYLAGPAWAESTDPMSRMDPIIEQLLQPENILRGQFTEQDVTEIFAIIRANMAGKQVEPSERLKKKMETFGQSLQARGALVGLLLLNELEASVKQMVRELNQQPGAI